MGRAVGIFCESVSVTDSLSRLTRYYHRLKTQTDNVNDGNEISLVSCNVRWQHQSSWKCTYPVIGHTRAVYPLWPYLVNNVAPTNAREKQLHFHVETKPSSGPVYNLYSYKKPHRNTVFSNTCSIKHPTLHPHPVKIGIICSTDY